jgi:hypothetical protein
MARHAAIFHSAAKAAGVDLVADVRLPWLTRHGHLSSEVRDRLPGRVIAALDAILEALEGDADALAAKTRGAMTADFLSVATSLEVEYDEIQHFTTARIATLKLYPPDARLAFVPEEYLTIAKQWRACGDKGFAHKQAAEFHGPSGRQRQRAYFDAFRDLAAPYFGNGPVLRVPAPDNRYDEAVELLQAMLAELSAD